MPSAQRSRSFSFHPSSATPTAPRHPPPTKDLTSIEPLDLPATLPLSLLALRHFLLGHVLQVEKRLQSISSQLASSHSDDDYDSDEADDHDLLPPSPLRDFMHQVSAYVDQLKSDVFGSDLSAPNSPLAQPTLPELRLRETFDGVVHSMSIPDATNLVQTLTLHAEKLQQVLSQLSIFSLNPSTTTIAPDLFTKPTTINEEQHSNSNNLDSLRNYFRSESERLSSLLIPSVLTDSITQSSNTLTSTLLAYKHEAKLALEGGENFIREEGEKLKEWVDAETESLRLALQAGASRLLTYHELPHEWKNNRFILSGYRFIPLDRWRELLYSGLQWHNETSTFFSSIILDFKHTIL